MSQATAAAEDGDLVRGFVETRDRWLFEELVQRYKQRVFRLCASILGPGSEAEAEEVAQDVFLQVLRRIDGFRQESGFTTWLYRIAYNRAIDRKRSAGWRLRATGDAPVDRPATGQEGDPFTAVLSSERQRLFRECLEDLPELYRTAVHLHYWMGWTVEEIGEALGAPPNTVKSYLHRARARLGALLRKKGIHHA